MARNRVRSGAPWEELVGYCRAVRVGNHVSVSGTAPVEPDGSVTSPGDGYSQARRCLEIIHDALQVLDVDSSQVIRSRMYVTDISRWEEFGRAHAEYFGDHPPASTMVEVSALIDPDMLIEIEVDAIVSE